MPRSYDPRDFDTTGGLPFTGWRAYHALTRTEITNDPDSILNGMSIQRPVLVGKYGQEWIVSHKIAQCGKYGYGDIARDHLLRDTCTCGIYVLTEWGQLEAQWAGAVGQTRPCGNAGEVDLIASVYASGVIIPGRTGLRAECVALQAIYIAKPILACYSAPLVTINDARGACVWTCKHSRYVRSGGETYSPSQFAEWVSRTYDVPAYARWPKGTERG